MGQNAESDGSEQYTVRDFMHGQIEANTAHTNINAITCDNTWVY